MRITLLIVLFLPPYFVRAQQQDSLQFHHILYLYNHQAFGEAYEILDSPLWIIDSTQTNHFNLYALHICNELYKKTPQMNSGYLNSAILYSKKLEDSGDSIFIKQALSIRDYLTTEIYNHLVPIISEAVKNKDTVYFESVSDSTLISFSYFNCKYMPDEALDYLGALFYNEGVQQILYVNIATATPEQIAALQKRAGILFVLAENYFKEICSRNPKDCKYSFPLLKE